MSFFSFPHLNFGLIFNTPVLVVIFLAFIAFYSTVASVLMYHWSAYGMKNHGIKVARALFIFVSIILCVTAFLGLHYF